MDGFAPTDAAWPVIRMLVLMTVALPMYLRMGFVKLRDAPPIFGVEYAVYTKAL